MTSTRKEYDTDTDTDNDIHSNADYDTDADSERDNNNDNDSDSDSERDGENARGALRPKRNRGTNKKRTCRSRCKPQRTTYNRARDRMH